MCPLQNFLTSWFKSLFWNNRWNVEMKESDLKCGGRAFVLNSILNICGNLQGFNVQLSKLLWVTLYKVSFWWSIRNTQAKCKNIFWQAYLEATFYWKLKNKKKMLLKWINSTPTAAIDNQKEKKLSKLNCGKLKYTIHVWPVHYFLIECMRVNQL